MAASCPIVLIPVLLLLVSFRVALYYANVKYDPREPPIIHHRVPYVGHIIGIFRYGAKYFEALDQKYRHPIYTLPTLTTRTYIVTSPSIAAIIQRSSKSTSFYTAILEVTRRLVAFDESSMRIIWNNANRENGTSDGVMPESHDMIARVLGPGPTLNAMSLVQLEKFAMMLSRIPVDNVGVEVELHAWVREVFVVANAFAIYGPENPFALHPELVKDFWIFEEGMISLLANIFPAVTARRPYLARKRILAALAEFVEQGHYKNASQMIQQRVSINLKHGLTTEMAGHAELIMLFGILGNAVPTTFWLLANIFSRPDLLQELRNGVAHAVTVTKPDDSTKTETRAISVSKLRKTSPLFISAFRETLRTVADLSSVRWILQDTLIADRYLLKANSLVQIASGVIHANKDIWGHDADRFDARRFLTAPPMVDGKTTDESVLDKGTALPPLPKDVPSAAYRAFGGGSVICPGRHFAQSEIVGFAALLAMGFEIERVGGGGAMELPGRNSKRIPFAVMKPDRECRVNIRRREGMDRVNWVLALE